MFEKINPPKFCSIQYTLLNEALDFCPAFDVNKETVYSWKFQGTKIQVFCRF